MGIDSIISSNQLPQSQENQTKQVLGKDDFLKLMLIQMRNQDPLNPMDNQQMLSQMAQFSSLEQMANLNENLTNSNTTAEFMDATRLLGKIIHISDRVEGIIQSKVKSVSMSSQGPLMTLENQQVVTVDQILQVEEPEE